MSKARDIADLDFNSPDIDGGNIDGATIGGTTPAAGTFSGLTVNGSGGRQYINSGHIRLSDGYNIEWGGGTNFLRGNNSNGGMALNATGNLTIDVVGDIELNADGGDWLFRDGSVNLGSIQNDGNNNLIVMSNTNDKAIKFLGIDNSNTVTALLLDMENAGAATFNSTVTASSYFLGSSNEISLATGSSGNIFLRPNGQSTSGQMQLASSGAATFNNHIKTQTLLQSIGADTQTNVTASQNIGIHLQNTSNTDGNFVPIDFYNSTGFVTGRIGAEFQDAGDRNTDLYFATRANGGGLIERFRIASTGGITHTSVAGGHVRFNSGVIDSDFTVSSDGYSHMLHVDGANNQVNIGTSANMGGLLNVRRNTASQFSTYFENLNASGYGQGWNSVSGHQVFMYHGGAHVGNISTASNYIKYSTGSSADLRLQAGGTRDVIVNGDGADTNFRVASDDQAYMLFVDGGNDRVGIMDSVPQDYLEINGSGRGLGGLTISNSSADHAALSFARSSTATARIFIHEPGALHTSSMRFQTSNASGGSPNLITAMTIDENQNVLVGTTNPLPAISNVQGIALSSGSYGGRLEASRTGGAPVCFNRLENGSVLEIKKSGVTAGIIGATGSQSYIHGGGTDVGIYFGSNNLYPYRQAGLNDATIDLGQASKRFKDLYLSGGIHLGGTGAANKLEDYEEGTWTPDLTDSSNNSVTQSTQTGHYTKIGNLVYVIFGIQVSSTSGAGNGLQIRNLPFTVANVTTGGGEPSGGTLTFANNLQSTDLGGGVILRANNATNYIEMKYTPGGAQTTIGGVNWNTSQIGSNTFMTGSCWYSV